MAALAQYRQGRWSRESRQLGDTDYADYILPTYQRILTAHPGIEDQRAVDIAVYLRVREVRRKFASLATLVLAALPNVPRVEPGARVFFREGNFTGTGQGTVLNQQALSPDHVVVRWDDGATQSELRSSLRPLPK